MKPLLKKRIGDSLFLHSRSHHSQISAKKKSYSMQHVLPSWSFAEERDKCQTWGLLSRRFWKPEFTKITKIVKFLQFPAKEVCFKKVGKTKTMEDLRVKGWLAETPNSNFIKFQTMRKYFLLQSIEITIFFYCTTLKCSRVWVIAARLDAHT